MDRHKLAELMRAVAVGLVSPDDACEQMRDLPFQDLGFATLDSHRALRQGLPEVVFCPGKSPQHIVEIMQRLSLHHQLVLASRATSDVAQAVKEGIPEVSYHEASRILFLGKLPDIDEALPAVNVICAGTADVPVAEEAAMILQTAGVEVFRTYDVGVAGLHRLLDRLPELRKNGASIVVAGMDGVLPSVVAGLLPGPVIAVPTSIGYGASFGGVAALLTMLNSCAAGLTVVNIDNGFGAGVAAFRAVSLAKARRAVTQET
jgi:NCAIR mutase (PurE)-related protein